MRNSLTMDNLNSTDKEQRTANTRFASCGVTCLHSSSVFQLGFSGRLTVLCSENPHERKAWERYLQYHTKQRNRLKISILQ
jgi:hypothetical protein